MRFSRLHRGLFEDLPSSLDYGEVYICSDTTQVFMGLEDKSVEEIRDKKVLQEIANIKEDIEAKDTFLKNEIATTNETVEANKQEANKKIADLTQKVNENQQGSNASLEALEQKVDNNKTTTDQTIVNLEKKVDGNKTTTDNTISALTEKVNTNKSDADSKYNANLEKINQNKTYGENTYVKRAEYLTGNQDFNNLITPGAYFLGGAVHTNKPSSLQSGKGGFLQVSKFVSQGNTTIIQVFTDEVSGVTYSRVKTFSDNNTSWTEWNTHYSMNSKPTPGDINSYTKQEIDNKDTATLNSAKAYTYSKAEIDSKDTTTLNSAKSYADTKKNEAVTFATTELAKKLNLTGGALTGTLSFDRDNLGLVFYQNAKVYKKSGSGLTLAPHNDDLGVSIEDTQGNLIMRIAKNSPLIYRGNAVYHAGNKPTPADIGTYTKAEIDSKDTTTLNNAKTYANNTFIEKSPTRLDNKDLNTITNPGTYVCVNCTNAPMTYGRMEVLVWSDYSTAKWVTQIFYTDTNNKMYTRCSTNEAGTTWTPWAMVYSSTNKPTASDIGARPSNWVPSWNDIQNKPSTFAPSSHNHDSAYLGINATAKNSEKLFGYGQYIGRNQGGSFGIPVVGSDGVMKTGFIIDMHLNNSTKDYDGRLQLNSDGSRLAFNSNTIYTTGNKPTPSDIGASPSDHNHNSSYLPLINGSDNQSYVLRKKYIQIGENDSKSMNVGVGPTDTYINNNTSGKYLALKDNGDLHYGGKKVLRDIQGTPLWQGYHHMSKAEKVTPSKPLSQCNNGWVIVWSDWDDGSQGQDWNVVYSYIPKNSLWKNGNNHLFGMASSNTQWAIKALDVRDDYIQGDDVNKQGNAYDVVIRAVLEY